MHGTPVANVNEWLAKSRVLVGGVMTAIVQRAEYMRRIGDKDEDRDRFLDELSKTKWGGAILGVEPSNARWLWWPEGTFDDDDDNNMTNLINDLTT